MELAEPRTGKSRLTRGRRSDDRARLLSQPPTDVRLLQRAGVVEGLQLDINPRFAGPGLLSFPRPGWTLALDFPARTPAPLPRLDRLDRLVMEHGGRVYLAKDSHVARRALEAMYPRVEEFRKIRAEIDPCTAMKKSQAMKDSRWMVSHWPGWLPAETGAGARFSGWGSSAGNVPPGLAVGFTWRHQARRPDVCYATSWFVRGSSARAAIRKKSQRGSDEIRVTTGHAAQAMATPITVSLA